MNQYLNRILPSMLGFILLSSASFAQDPELPRVAEKFEVNGRTAVLYAAPEPAAGRPWVWYAPALGGGLSLRQRTLYYESFLKAGIAIAGYDLGEVRGSPASTKKFTAFHGAMVKRGFSPKPILLGQSRGGMMMLAWGTTHPDKVGAFVGIYPVCNLASWPLTRSKAATLADFGLPEAELRASLKQFNPVDNLSGLARERVPMFIVHGDSDKAAPLDENSALLRDRYQAVGGPITVKVIEGEGHRVCPAFFECPELVDFVLAQLPAAQAQGALRNERYSLWTQPDGSLHVANAEGDGHDVFRPEFTTIYSAEKPTTSGVKWEQPIYNLPAWRIGDETVTDIFKVGEIIELRNPKIEIRNQTIVWTFDHERVRLTATVSLPDGKAEPQIDYTAAVKADGWFTFAYTGAPAVELDQVTRLWQPLVWDGRRLPVKSFLIPDEHCSIPGCLVERAGRTTGVMADPWQFPFEMPHGRNRKFGVTVRNANGEAQPMVFAPFIGSDTRFTAGDRHEFRVRLVSRPGDLSQTFEHVARNVCGFRDQRENTLTTLNQTLDNMADYALSKWARFDSKNKSSYYPDAKGTVKNVSCLHPFGVALVTDNPRFFHEQTVPMMEYLLSREKFLFAIAEEGLSHSQKPSMNLNGPAMPVSELAALHRIARGNSPVFREQAARLYAVDRRLNMNWVTPGSTWQRSLSLYRATGDRKWLADAGEKADRYIAERIETAPVDFSEAADGTFFEYMVPWWKELYELYLETGNRNHLAAAHAGARRYAQFVWFYPSVPDGEIAVNPRGLAPRRGRPDGDGVLPVPMETVPNWRVSDQGLICEGNGTVQRLGILLATHAPIFLRIANDTDDGFLRDIARSAVIGRYANFPGYHLNTRFSTAQEKPDFPLHSHGELKPTTSMHYNHILPMVNLLIDYLISRSYDLSNGAIDFPGEFAEGYAYLQGKIYGAHPGRFYDETHVTPWMPKGLLTVGNVQVNYVAARGGNKLCLAFMNASDRSLGEVEFELNPDWFENLSGEKLQAQLWLGNERQTEPLQITNGIGRVSLSPKGLTALSITGLKPRVQFQNQLGEAAAVSLENNGPAKVAGSEVEGMILSFGPNLRWLYTFLRSENGKPDIRSATLAIEIDGKSHQFVDETFPHDFSVPIGDAKTVRFSWFKSPTR